MIGFALLFWGLALIFALIAIKPRAIWWTMSSWAYRNPKANEPSDVAYGLQSVMSGIAAIGCVVGGFVMLGIESPEEQRERDRQEEASCDRIVSAAEEAYDAGGIEAAQDRAHELGYDTEVHEAPPSDLPDVDESTIDIPAELWLYDRDLPEGDQFVASVGGPAGGSRSYCGDAARAA